MKYFLFVFLCVVLVACGTAVDNEAEISVNEVSQELTKPVTTVTTTHSAPTATPDPTPTITATVTMTSTRSQSQDAVTVPTALTSFIDEMKADLSDHLSVPMETISVAAIQDTTWRDGSLGCPQPGMMYTMALVDGYQVTLTADGKSYQYHTRGTDSFIRCVKGQSVAPDSPTQ